MHIPIWLPCVVAVALLLTAFFAQAQRRVEERPVSLEFLGRTWSAALVAVAVAVVLTWDHFSVGDEELREAVDRAAAELESSASFSTDGLRYAAQDALGREVHVDDVDIPEGENDSPVTGYEFRPSEGSDTVVCLEVESYGGTVAPVTYGTSVSIGACEE